MYSTILTALQATGIPFAEVAWSNAPSTDYGTFAIDSAYGSHWADGHMRGQTLEGTVHLFAHSPDPARMHVIQGALNAIDGLSWYLNSVQFEDNTKLMHWEWVVSWPE